MTSYWYLLTLQVTAGRGNNLHEVETAQNEKFLVSMPTRFRKNVWIKRGLSSIDYHVSIQTLLLIYFINDNKSSVLSCLKVWILILWFDVEFLPEYTETLFHDFDLLVLFRWLCPCWTYWRGWKGEGGNCNYSVQRANQIHSGWGKVVRWQALSNYMSVLFTDFTLKNSAI